MSQPAAASHEHAEAEAGEARAPGPIDHEAVAPSFDYAEMMKRVTAEGIKSYFAQVKEMYALKFGPGKISPVEYYYYGLYDDGIPLARKKAFVGQNLRAELNKRHLEHARFQLGVDKVAFCAHAAEHGIAVPRTRALVHPSAELAGAESLRTAADFAAWLRRPDAYPFFAKPAQMSASVGTASVEAYNAASDELELADGRRFAVDTFVAEASRYFEQGYLVQERLKPHPAMAAASTPRVSTLRILIGRDAPDVLSAYWRVPVAGAAADVLWRGNLMASLDPATGVVRRVVKGRGLDQQVLEAHPDTGAKLVGFQVPLWREAVEAALAASRTVPELKLTGWDVAVTDQGPRVIELEPDGGEPTMHQLASGQGLLDGPYGEFLARLKQR